jgi:hypothetical protein
MPSFILPIAFVGALIRGNVPRGNVEYSSITRQDEVFEERNGH